MLLQKDIDKVEEISRTNTLMNKGNRSYCFLDFDGVINIWDKPLGPVEKSIKESLYQMVHEDCVSCLSDFCLKNNLDIVVSSTWRFKGLDFCRDFLYGAGLDQRINIVGVTPMSLEDSREVNILNYLLEHQDFNNFIIIDDIKFEYLTTHLVQCDSLVGFNMEKQAEAQDLWKKTSAFDFDISYA